MTLMMEYLKGPALDGGAEFVGHRPVQQHPPTCPGVHPDCWLREATVSMELRSSCSSSLSLRAKAMRPSETMWCSFQLEGVSQTFRGKKA